MNEHTDSLVQWSYTFGIALGIFLSITLLMLLSGFYLYFFQKKYHGGALFLAGALATVCFTLFSFFVVSIHSVEFSFYFPSIAVFLGKICMPIGLFFNFQMIVQAIPIKTLDSFLFWYKIKKFYALFYVFLLLAFILNSFFITNLDYVSAIIFALIILSNIFGLLIARFSEESIFFSRLHNLILITLAVLSMIAIYLLLYLDFDLVPEGFIQSLCLTFAVFVFIYNIVIARFIIVESLPYENISKYNIDGFYKNIYHALNHDEFFIHYQPKTLIDTDEVCGLEALIRWNHSKNGMVPPNEFIPIAEKTEIIDHICQWVIRQVVADIKFMKSQGVHLPISINFSVKNIHPEMVKFLLTHLEESNLSVNTIVVEITESLFLEMTEEHKEALNQIDQAGIKLSLDDFGAGYSSLRHLDNMKLSEVKIDKSLIDSILDEKKNTIVSTIMEMCHALDIEVVAEGINDEKTVDSLRQMNCEMGQGYGICRPKPLNEILMWVKKQQRK